MSWFLFYLLFFFIRFVLTTFRPSGDILLLTTTATDNISHMHFVHKRKRTTTTTTEPTKMKSKYLCVFSSLFRKHTKTANDEQDNDNDEKIFAWLHLFPKIKTKPFFVIYASPSNKQNHRETPFFRFFSLRAS